MDGIVLAASADCARTAWHGLLEEVPLLRIGRLSLLVALVPLGVAEVHRLPVLDLERRMPVSGASVIQTRSAGRLFDVPARPSPA
jgi:hypothetical protein